MKKLTIFLAFLLFVSFQAAAQMQITGKVTSAEDGMSIPGVSVVVKSNPTIGTTTDIDGNYSISVPANSETLVFSFIGMVTQEEIISGRSVIDVVLEPDILQMEEVIVVGYGSQSKKLITGSVASVGAEELENEVIQSVDNALQGRMSGVRVTSNSGTPGGGISVRIRGASSILAGNEPLYVVDGVPINVGNYSQEDYGGQDLSATTSINPNDIEDIQVLKDASYAAIYGARAANGVVLITTKTGKTGQSKINFNYSTGTQQIIKKRDLLNAEQYIEAMDDALMNSYGLGFDDIYWNAYDPDTDTDWQDEVTRVAPISEYQLSASGGSEQFNYYVSGGYMDQEGIVIGSDYERISGRLNMDVNASDKLTIGTRIQISKENINRIWGDNNIYAPLANAFAVEPVQPVYNEDGTYNTNTLYANPVAMGKEPKHFTQIFRTIGNLFFEYDIIKNLTFKSSVNADLINLREDSFLPTDVGIAVGSNGDGI
jgi:TonB-linked SusC/RagA family outer membrane protein